MKKKVIGGALLGVSIIFLVLAVLEEYPYRKNERQMESLRTLAAAPAEEENADPYLERQIDFKTLGEINQDIIGWISIPDTPVDYPILKNPADDFYLYRDYAGNPNPAGSIFMRTSIPEDFSGRHTILYGHNMMDGQMFGSLPDFQAQESMERHPHVYIYQPEQVLRGRIYSAYTCMDATETYRTEFGDQEDWEQWMRLTETLGKSRIQAADTDRILTLSTCTADGKERFVVHCSLEDGKEAKDLVEGYSNTNDGMEASMEGMGEKEW